LVLDSKGAIYGTTYFGGDESGECGSVGCGTAFKLDPPTQKGGAWTEKILYLFDATDGAGPRAGVIFGKNGELYGTTYAGANSGYGAVFSLTAPKTGSKYWKETVLYRFDDGNDGANPESDLIFDISGDLYGTTYSGGTFSGTVFRLKPPSQKGGNWTFTILYGFTGTSGGAQPAAGLILDKHGNLYSTTELGGSGSCEFYGCGTAFEVSP
jgi:uncharacterized repeat protein (TIGR03803 family)